MSLDIITEPKVRLVGRQTIDEAALADFLKDEGAESWTTDTDIAAQRLSECAGRICYKSYAKPRPGGNAAYLGHLLEVGHGSVIESAVFNFIITGVSRSFTHELIRHRAGFSYSQRSQRFCDERELSVVVPPALAGEVESARRFIAQFGDPAPSAIDAMNYVLRHAGVANYAKPDSGACAGLQWLAHMEMSRQAYADLGDYLAGRCESDRVRAIEASRGGRYPTGPLGSAEKTAIRKQAREAARSVLPNATETQIFVTANARALRTMFEQRGAPGADAEMRRVAVAMCRIMLAEAPNLFGDFAIVGGPAGESLECKFHKV